MFKWILRYVWIVYKSLKYDVIKWCIYVLNDVCNEVKVWSKHIIFRKENNMLRLLLRCIDLWVSCERDNPDSTDIMDHINEFIQLVKVEGGPFGWVWGLKELIRAYLIDLPCHMRWWDIEMIMRMTILISKRVIWQVEVFGC